MAMQPKCTQYTVNPPTNPTSHHCAILTQRNIYVTVSRPFCYSVTLQDRGSCMTTGTPTNLHLGPTNALHTSCLQCLSYGLLTVTIITFEAFCGLESSVDHVTFPTKTESIKGRRLANSEGNHPIDAMLKWALEIDQKID